MNTKFLFPFLLFFLVGCARIPAESITLVQFLKLEGQKMHQTNVALVNAKFQEKAKAVDQFIYLEYIDGFAQEFAAKIPDEIDLHREFPAILRSSLKEVSRTRNDMQSSLENNRVEVLTKLEQDFARFSEACLSLEQLLRSSNALSKSQSEFIGNLYQLSPKPLDISMLDSSLNQLLWEGTRSLVQPGELSETVERVLND
ncbi:MAG: hypothetical protein ACXITV_00045 [Luteibaculaceae bacterium]